MMQQKTVLQRLTRKIPWWCKSSFAAGAVLKYGSTALGGLGLKRLLYDNDSNIISRILSDLNRPVKDQEIQIYQEECRTLFRPDQRLFYTARELILYPLIRILKPSTVVETGCHWGGTAAFLLAALDKNGAGQLISVDIPACETVQMKETDITGGQDIGALIPGDLKRHWKLILGDARKHLPKLLAEVDADIFIHDSLHTTTHQAFEYETARSLMRDKTIIASDDIRWNASFAFFLKLHGLKGYAPLTFRNFGITVNVFDAYEKQCGLYR